ncbi:DUF1259 domain-containing protein [Chungangia koreensis]|uniref:DUF1259 domain-containing protein n=1 Tax=Chungangia koreensis TaxID=752657 RepID=A0ABV8X8A6_9LACT
MTDFKELCQQFSSILGGELNIKKGVCTVQKKRSHINVKIMGRPANSVLQSFCSFESIDHQGKALNLGEIALLQEEVYPFTWSLQRSGIILTALHNHWLFDNPRILYAHFISVEDPLSFAHKVAEAFQLLK